MAEIPLHLPLWYLLNTTQTGADSIVSGTGSAGAKVVLVFQTEAQAKARVKSKPIFRTIPISDQAGLEAFLDTAEQKEFSRRTNCPDRPVQKNLGWSSESARMTIAFLPR